MGVMLMVLDNRLGTASAARYARGLDVVDRLDYVVATARLTLSYADLPMYEVPSTETYRRPWDNSTRVSMHWQGVTVFEDVWDGEPWGIKQAASLGKRLANALLLALPAYGDNIDEWGVRYA